MAATTGVGAATGAGAAIGAGAAAGAEVTPSAVAGAAVLAAGWVAQALRAKAQAPTKRGEQARTKNLEEVVDMDFMERRVLKMKTAVA